MNISLSKYKILSHTVLLAVLLAFGGALFFAKKYSDYPKTIEEIILIDNTKENPKQLPVEKGGQKFPHVDKTVFKILER